MKPQRSIATVGLLTLLILFGSSCASLDFEPEGPGYGTFKSSAWCFTILSRDFPGSPLLTARGNAADSGQPNLLIEKEFVWPYWGRFDWLLDIISFRYASVRGTWGVAPAEAATEDATPESNSGS